VLEESPAPDFDASALHRAAVDFSRAARYVGAGTCEFLVGDGGEFGFIEMNARLQVEHPVTELVTGLDLVELQLRVAQGEPLAVREVAHAGHAIEVRVYAEDPEEDFLPQAGRAVHVRWPEGVRVDSGIEEGTDVPPQYDPLLAKIVAHGADRASALAALEHALEETEVLGVRNNVAFLLDVVRDPVVAGGKVTTDWLEDAYADWRPERDERAALAVAAAAEVSRAPRSSDPWTSFGSWRAGGFRSARVVLRSGDREHVVDPYVDGEVAVERADRHHGWVVGGVDAAAARDGDTWCVAVRGVTYEFAVGIGPRRPEGAASHLDSPLPGQVVAVRAADGQHVEAGDELVVVEAMKMEHAIRAPAKGVVTSVLCRQGDQVARGQPLVDFEPT
jgi:acetyl-CoA/propionyl-CoA carboxylase biotin carboxyl carrier protein